MNTLPKAVIEDLLPLYAAGEASPETVALLDQELPRYPDLRQQLEAMRDFTPPLAAAPPDTHELEAVAATSSLLSRRSWSLAIAICTSFLPSTLVVQSSKLTFQMARDQPAVSAVSLVIAYSAWLVYFDASRRLAATGLQTAPKLRQRLFWIAMGSGLGYQIALILGQQIGHAWWHAVFPMATAALFFYQSRPE